MNRSTEETVHIIVEAQPGSQAIGRLSLGDVWAAYNQVRKSVEAAQVEEMPESADPGLVRAAFQAGLRITKASVE